MKRAAAKSKKPKEEVHFEVYHEGLFHMSACTNLRTKKAAEEAAALYVFPSGTSHGWRITEKKFRTGEKNGCPCDQHPETRVHWLFTC